MLTILLCFVAVSVRAGCGDFNWGRRCIGYAHNTWQTASIEECRGKCANKNAKGCCGATNFYKSCFWFGNNGMTSTNLIEGSTMCYPATQNPYKCHTWTAQNQRAFHWAHGGRSKQDVCRLDAKGFYIEGKNGNYPGCSSSCECCVPTAAAKWEPHGLKNTVEERVLLEHGHSEKDVCHATGRAWTDGDNRWGFAGCGDQKCCGLKGKRYHKADISKYEYTYHCGSETSSGQCSAAGGVWTGGNMNVYKYPGCMACKCCKKGYKWVSNYNYEHRCVSRSGGGTSAFGNFKDLTSGRCCGYDEGCMPKYKCRNHGSYTCSPYPGSMIFAAFSKVADQVDDLVDAAFNLM